MSETTKRLLRRVTLRLLYTWPMCRYWGLGKVFLKPLASPRLNACQEFGKLAARMHAIKCVGALDITNCTFEQDGTLKSIFGCSRARFLEHALSTEERAQDLATWKKEVSEPEWEATKLGYRFGAPDDAEEVLRFVEQLAH